MASLRGAFPARVRICPGIAGFRSATRRPAFSRRRFRPSPSGYRQEIYCRSTIGRRMRCYFRRGLDTCRPREHLGVGSTRSRNDGFGRRLRNWRHATIGFIFELRAVPDQTPPGPDRRHRGCQSAGGRRIGRSERHGLPARCPRTQALELMRIDNGNRFRCAARRVFCDVDGGRKSNSRIQIRVHQTTIAQSNDKGKMTIPRYSQVR